MARRSTPLDSIQKELAAKEAQLHKEMENLQRFLDEAPPPERKQTPRRTANKSLRVDTTMTYPSMVYPRSKRSTLRKKQRAKQIQFAALFIIFLVFLFLILTKFAE